MGEPQHRQKASAPTLASASSSAFFLASSSSKDRGWACECGVGLLAAPNGDLLPHQSDPPAGSCSQPSPLCPLLTFSFFSAFSSSSSAFRESLSFRDFESLPLLGDKLPSKTKRNQAPNTAPGSPRPHQLRESCSHPGQYFLQRTALGCLWECRNTLKREGTDLDRFLSLSRRCPSFSRSRSFLVRSRSRSLCRRSLQNGAVTAWPQAIHSCPALCRAVMDRQE